MSDEQIQRLDSLVSLLTGLGDPSRDKSKSFSFSRPKESREQVHAAYQGDALSALIVDIVPYEVFRVPVQVKMDDTKAAELAAEWLVDSGALDAVERAIKSARLDGGAAVYINTGADPASPVEPGEVPLWVEFEVFSRFDLYVAKRYADPQRANYGKPSVYRTHERIRGGLVMPAKDIHVTRLAIFQGIESFAKDEEQASGNISEQSDLQDWGFSVLARVMEISSLYGASWLSLSQVLIDGAQVLLKLKGLTDLLRSPDGRNSVARRLLITDTARSNARAVALDADNEDLVRQAYAFGNVADVLDRLQQHVSMVAGVPVTKLFGRSPAGLNATGKSDTEMFYNQVRTLQERKCRPALEQILGFALALPEGPTNGQVPESYVVGFGPLEEPSAVEQATLRKTQAETDAIYTNAGVLMPEEIAINRFRKTGWSSETTVDTDLRVQQLELDAQPANTEAAAALNGAQVTSLVSVAENYNAGVLTREAAIAIITTAFPVSQEIAEKIIPVTRQEPAAKPAPFGGAPTPKPPMDPNADNNTNGESTGSASADDQPQDQAQGPKA